MFFISNSTLGFDPRRRELKKDSLRLQAHLVAAFEKSLSNMTCRLQSLTMTAEQKVPELPRPKT